MSGIPRKITYKIDKNGCHICTSHSLSRGYPEINRKGVKRLSHLIYEQNYGPIPEGHIILHKCDNPPCINPEHLFSGTHADNVKDKVSKGRQAKGSKNGRAKLTENQVQEILESPHNSPQILAERFGVSIDTIRKIRNGQRWNRTQIVPAQNLSNSSSPQLIDNKVIKVPPARFELATHGLGSHAASSITVQGNKD